MFGWGVKNDNLKRAFIWRITPGLGSDDIKRRNLDVGGISRDPMFVVCRVINHLNNEVI